MKLFFLAFIGLSLTACITQRPLQNQPRKTYNQSFNEIDDLERILDNRSTENFDYSDRRVSSYRPKASVRIGMGKKNVQSKFGSPDEVEIAGNPKYGNERWTYERNVRTSRGSYEERKVIYFENGTVVGWEVQ